MPQLSCSEAFLGGAVWSEDTAGRRPLRWGFQGSPSCLIDWEKRIEAPGHLGRLGQLEEPGGFWRPTCPTSVNLDYGGPPQHCPGNAGLGDEGEGGGRCSRLKGRESGDGD